MTQTEFNTFMDSWMNEQMFNGMIYYAKKRENSSWIDKNDTVNKAIEAGFTDGSSPMGLVTRAEVWAMLLKIIDK